MVNVLSIYDAEWHREKDGDHSAPEAVELSQSVRYDLEASILVEQETRDVIRRLVAAH